MPDRNFESTPAEAVPMPKPRPPRVVTNTNVDLHPVEPNLPAGGLKGTWGMIGNMSAVAVGLCLLVFMTFWMMRSNSEQHRDMMQFIREESAANRTRHENDIHTLIAPISEAVKEMRQGREEVGRENQRQHDTMRGMLQENKEILRLLDKKPG